MNFSNDELQVLLLEVQQRRKIIEEPLSNKVTQKIKDSAWDSVLSSVNSVSAVKRSRCEIKKKFTDFKSVTKKKVAKMNKLRSQTGSV